MRDALEAFLKACPDESDLEHWADIGPCPQRSGDDNECTCSEEARRIVMRDAIDAMCDALAKAGGR